MAFASPLSAEDETRRLEYAAELLRLSHDDNAPYLAAEKLFPNLQDLGKRTYIAAFWPTHPEVINEKTRLINEEGEKNFLPTDVQLAKLLWQLANDPHSQKKDRLTAAKQYAELMGFVNAKGVGNGGATDEPQDQLPKQPTYKIVNE